jgi:hypothetical protein
MDETTWYFVFYLAAFVLFVVSAFQLSHARVNLVSLGLAFAVLPLLAETLQKL